MYCAPTGEVTVIEPFRVKHVGCVVFAVTVGAPAGVLIVVVAVAWQDPAAVLFTVIVYDPAGRLLNTGDDWKVVPLMLYVYWAPSGEVTVTVPVGIAQVGCISVNTGGTAPPLLLMVAVVENTQPLASLTAIV